MALQTVAEAGVEEFRRVRESPESPRESAGGNTFGVLKTGLRAQRANAGLVETRFVLRGGRRAAGLLVQLQALAACDGIRIVDLRDRLMKPMPFRIGHTVEHGPVRGDLLEQIDRGAKCLQTTFNLGHAGGNLLPHDQPRARHLGAPMSAYQSSCGDHSLQRRHCVSCHCRVHAGQTPRVSNVFQTCRQLQHHRSSGRGSQLQRGHRMR